MLCPINVVRKNVQKSILNHYLYSKAHLKILLQDLKLHNDNLILTCHYNPAVCQTMNSLRKFSHNDASGNKSPLEKVMTSQNGNDARDTFNY